MRIDAARAIWLFLAVALTAPRPPLLAQEAAAVQRQRIEAAFMLALGRPATADEMASAEQGGSRSIAELVEQLRHRLRDDAALERETIVRSIRDAFGRAPREPELTAPDRVLTYTELVKHHLRSLAEDPAEYEQVLSRAYRLVLRRDPYPEEVAYWKNHDTLSWILLVGCVENWARRNQPGLMVTTGTPIVSINSEFLATVWLSPAVAAEARAVAGVGSKENASAARAGGHNLVAPGADRIVTDGRIHFAAAGPEWLSGPAGDRAAD